MNGVARLLTKENCLLLATVVNRFVPRAHPQRYGMSIARGAKFFYVKMPKTD